jgi:WXG100 family type VII secretion target
MTAERIQVEYELLNKIAQEFASCSSEVESMRKKINASVENLAGGRWDGVGARAFFSEMERDVFPPLKKLSQTLTLAQDRTREISQIFLDAETRASQPFTSEKVDTGTTPIIVRIPEYNMPINGIDPNYWEAYPLIPGTVSDLNWTGTGNSIGEGWGGGGGGAHDYYYDPSINQQDSSFWNPNKVDIGLISGHLKPSEADIEIGVGVSHADEIKDLLHKVDRTEVFGYDIGGHTTDIHLGDYSYGLGAGYNINKGGYAGVMGDFTVAEITDADVIGRSSFGVYKSTEIDLLEGEGFIGYRDGNIGAMFEGNLAEAEQSYGFNVGGYRVGLKGSIAYGISAGFKLGKDGAEVKAGPFGVGIDIGKAYN